MELKLVNRKKLKELSKLDELLELVDIPIKDIKWAIETMRDIKPNVTGLNEAYGLTNDEFQETKAVVEKLTQENVMLKQKINGLEEKLKKYNEEVVKYTAENPIPNVSMETIVASFFEDPELKAQVSINGKPLVEE